MGVRPDEDPVAGVCGTAYSAADRAFSMTTTSAPTQTYRRLPNPPRCDRWIPVPRRGPRSRPSRGRSQPRRREPPAPGPAPQGGGKCATIETLRAYSRCGSSVPRSWRMATWRPARPRQYRLPPVHENSSDAANSALSELAALLLSTQTFEELVQGVAELSVRTIASAATCGITLAQDDRVITVGSADALAAQLDEHQYEQHTGPCLEALKTGEVASTPAESTEGAN